MPRDAPVLLKGFNGEEFFRQCFFVVEIVNAVVADATNHDACLELSPGKPFPGLFPAVKFPGYKVMTGQKARLSAKFAFFDVGSLAVHSGNFDSSQLQNRFWASVLSPLS